MADLSKRDRGCWLMTGRAPPGTSMAEANAAFNAWVEDRARGFAWFHDHFADRPGGVAIVAVETGQELAALREPGPLAGWDLEVHPLIFAGERPGFLSQVDFTTTVYRGHRRDALWESYRDTEDFRRNRARPIEP